MKTNPNDPAFPFDGDGGLTKRELFAAVAMAGIEASNSLDSYLTSKEVARRAQENADALIQKLNEGKENETNKI